MKTLTNKLLAAIILVFILISENTAQDLIYTVSGILDNEKIALDSILVENLSNNTRLLFGPLPSQDEYRINLSKKVLTSVDGMEVEGPAFSVAQNYPGTLKLRYNRNVPSDIRIEVFNMNGQTLYTSEREHINHGNSVNIILGSSGVYLVRVQSTGAIETFKALGSSKQQNYDVNIEGSASKVNILKSTDPPVEFEYNIGDSLRISAYKNHLYAWPEGIRIAGYAPIDFQFRESTVKTTGISDAYIPLYENLTSVSSYNESTGELELEFSGEQPDLKPGGIIITDVDTSMILRKIISVEITNNGVKVITEQASLSDIFIDKDFKLHTGLISGKSNLKSARTYEEISEALTDDNGYIHPIRVGFCNNDDLIIKSAFEIEENNTDTVNLLSYEESLAKDLYGEEGEDVHFYSNDQSKFSLRADCIYEFKFDPDMGELTEDTKVRKGDIQEFKCWLEGNQELKVMLELDLKKEIEKKSKDPKELLDLGNPYADFIVGPVLIRIYFDTGIFYQYNFSASAMVHADWGFEFNNQVKIGGGYNIENGEFYPIKYSSSYKDFYPLNLNGSVEAAARVEVYPRVEGKIYNVFGPYFELVPYLQGNFNMVGEYTTADQDAFFAWDNTFDFGLDFRVGVLLDLFGWWEKEWGPVTSTWFNETLWGMPHKLELLNDINDIPKNATVGTIVSLKFRVTNYSFFKDLNNIPVPGCPIYIKSGKSTSNQNILLTDLNGEASFDWKLSDKEEVNELIAAIYNTQKELIGSNITQSINTVTDYSKDSGVFTDLRNDQKYKWVKIGDQIWMAENLRYIPSDLTISPSDQPDVERAIANDDYDKSFSEPYYYIYGIDGIGGSVSEIIASYSIVKEYGVLYSHAAAMNGESESENNPSGVQGVCPDGWHIPSDSEWDELAEELGTTKIEGTDNWEEVGDLLKPGGNEPDFNAQYGGMRDRDEGDFYGLDYRGYWWSTSRYLNDCSYCRYIYKNNSTLYRTHLFKHYGLSVRCIKD